MDIVIETIRQAYGIDLTELQPIEGGLDAHAQTFRSGDYFVKLKTGLDPGIGLCVALHEAGIEAVVAPIKTLQGEPACSFGDKVLLVYPFVEGQNGFDRPLSLEHWRQLGRALRKIHDTTFDGYLAPELFEVSDTDRFAAQVASLLTEEGDFADFVRENLEKIERVIRRADELGKACRGKDWEQVPCHADLHVGNVLVNGDLHIVDWDAPRLAPRECDLVFIRDGGIARLHGFDEEYAFHEGYVYREPNLLLLTYYRYARALEDLVAFTHEALSMPGRTDAQKEEAIHWFKAQFKPNSIMESAFRSDSLYSQAR